MRKVIIMASLFLSTLALSVVALAASLFDGSGRTIHRIAVFWARLHLLVCGIRVSVRGRENVTDPPYVFMCNHQSALDIFSFLVGLPLPFRWIAKRELFRIPFFGWALTRAGYISLDRENPREAVKAIEEASRRIREGINIILFPEGTRSKDGVLLPFKKGSFNLAIRAGVPIVPVGIACSGLLQPPGSAVPKKRGVVYITIGEPVLPGGPGRQHKDLLMEEIRSRIERLMACRDS